MSRLNHFDDDGASRMVDVGHKSVSQRLAVAQALLRMLPETRQLIQNREVQKGDVLEVARLAGILAAKQTATLIPLCHPLPLDNVEMSFAWKGDQLVLESRVRCTARTGVEMEALTAVSVAALTVYDMCKSVDRGMRVESLRLIEKKGGKSGHYLHDERQ